MNIIWIIGGIIFLLIVLNCLQKRSKIECFKVIYKSLDNFNKKPIIKAVNDTFNEIQHLKSEASILDRDKYKNMYKWYETESYTENNMNNRKILLGKSKNKSEQKKEVMKNMRSVKDNQKDLQKLIDKKKNRKPPGKEQSVVNNLSSKTLEKDLNSKDLKDLQNEWVKAMTSRLVKEKKKYKKPLNKLNKKKFKKEVKQKYKEFVAECTKCGFKCAVHDIGCNDTEEEIKEGLLEIIKEPKRKEIMDKAREEAIKILMLRNLKDKNKLRYEIKLIKEDTIREGSSKEMGKWENRR
tara:strand:+ start:2181 stop:3065 length:885 start_codon:yes stop_codon:yes gene_type:complete